jgi:hypothetical protein
LAAIARPVGGQLIVRRSGEAVELALVPARGAEAWPIGWRPKEKSDGKLMPASFEFLTVEIDSVPASEAIETVQSRLKAPMLFDHNNIARHRIDLSKRVTIPAGRTYYLRALDRMLFQVGLKCEVRVDDAGTAFLWATTLKP